MTVLCPSCSAQQPFSDTDIPAGGVFVACRACGTRWLARPFEGLVPIAPPRLEVSDAVVIDDVGPHVVRQLPAPARLPPSWRKGTIDRRLKAAGIVLGVVAAFFVLRAPIVAALPETGRLSANAGLLEFQKVHSQTLDRGGISTLIVEGEIINRSGGTVDLPAVQVTLRDTNGASVAGWVVKLAAADLAAGTTIGFRSALASPPADAAQVTLNLAHRDSPTGRD